MDREVQRLSSRQRGIDEEAGMHADRQAGSDGESDWKTKDGAAEREIKQTQRDGPETAARG